MKTALCCYKTVLLVTACILPVGLIGCGNVAQILDAGAKVSQAVGYNPEQLTGGVKEVLTLSSTRAADTLGLSGGYSQNTQYRIGLPEPVQKVAQSLRAIGLGRSIDSVEQLMNEGAEKAAAQAQALFISAVKNMEVDDALGIIRGGDNAATDFFRRQTEPALKSQYTTIMQEQLNQLGFYGNYKKLLNAYQLVPIANKPALDLEAHAITLGMDALFEQVALEEAKIRANPVEQGSALIKAIFAQ